MTFFAEFVHLVAFENSRRARDASITETIDQEIEMKKIMAGIIATMPMFAPLSASATEVPRVEVPFQTETVLDLGEVQTEMQRMLNGIRQVSRCSENWNVWDAKVLPNGRSIKIDLQARYFLNKCLVVTRPEWHGPWTVRMKDRVIGETILVSQQAHLAVDVTPVVSNGVVIATADVVTADANGLLGKLKLNGQIKSFLNGKLNTALQDKLTAALPAEYLKAGVEISELQFFEQNGKLAAKVKASGKLHPGT